MAWGMTELMEAMYVFSHMSEILNTTFEVCVPDQIELVEAYAWRAGVPAIAYMACGGVLCIPYGVKKCRECCNDEKED